jgi:divalent metal cation (Fe/Co/Zn/Cd) transporter
MAATPALKLPDDAEIIRPVARHQSAHDAMNAQKVMAAFGQMRRLGWIALGYQIAAIALLGSLMGGSQSMKTELLENLLGAIPIIGLLIAHHMESKGQDVQRPFGYHRAATITFVAAAFTLAGMGAYLMFDSASVLWQREHPDIKNIALFGHTVWMGWLMMGAMAVTGIVPVILGRFQSPLAVILHDKPLHACAEMNRANALTNGAGVIGLLLVANGFWWGDAVAALLISFDILHDGWVNIARSLSDVMDRAPVDLETNGQCPSIAQVHRAVAALPFVAERCILMREHGRFFFAEIFIRPNEQMPDVLEAVLPLDWRLQHIAIEFTDDVHAASQIPAQQEYLFESVAGEGKP